MTLKENLAALQRDVRKLRAELGSRAGNVPHTDTAQTIRGQVHGFEVERAALLEIEGRQPAVVAFANDDTGKPIKAKLPPSTLTTPAKPMTRGEALAELERLQKSDAKAARAFYLRHKKLITGGRD